MDEPKLHGWVVELADSDQIRDALERAFDYRGDITITLKDGSAVEGFVFDRRSDAAALEDCSIRLMVKGDSTRITLKYSDIVRIEFSGRDAADGRSFELWVRRYNERKARGETGVSIDPEPLDS